MGKWHWHTGIHALLLFRAQCRPQEAVAAPPPFPMLNGTTGGFNLTNNSSTDRFLNPCTHKNFQPPLYQLDGLSIEKVFVTNESPAGRGYRASVNFNLTDVANNYSLSCTWGPRWDDEGEFWQTQDCMTVPAPVFNTSQTVTLLKLQPESLAMNKSADGPIRLARYWYCDTNGPYPQVYQSHVEITLNVTCPASGRADVASPCVVSNALAPDIKAQWQPTGPLPGTPRLDPKPTASVPAARGLSPPPARDCTDISFTHPDWDMSGFSFIQQEDQWEYRKAKLNVTLHSRASGARYFCRFGDDIVETVDGEMVALCTPLPDGSPNTSLKLTVHYLWQSRALIISEDWVCGDIDGRYSTNFTGTAYINVPTYHNSVSFVADPMTIHGSLQNFYRLTPSRIPGPSGSTNPGCTSRSLSVGDNLFSITKFLYQAANITASWPYYNPNPGQPDNTSHPHSRTLELEFRNEATGLISSCTFNDAALDNTTDRWWSCPFPQPPHTHTFPIHTIDTSIQFNRDSRKLVINQTWFCNDTQSATPFRFTGIGDTSYLPASPPLIAGSSNSTAYSVVCGSWSIFQFPIYCDITYSARWVSLGGHKDGRPGGEMGLRGQYVSQTKLPPNALTSPDPVPDRWSCTVSSLGHGPVVWTLQADEWMVFTSWFAPEKQRSGTVNTKLRFDLSSSVFEDRPGANRPIRAIGSYQPQVSWDDEGAVALTPWLRGFDPTRSYKSADRVVERRWYDPGWDFYEFLSWEVRLDVRTGYMELGHQWYCDDKNPERPIVFDAKWNGYVPLNCTYKFDGEGEHGVKCLPEGGKAVVTPTVDFWTETARIPDPTLVHDPNPSNIVANADHINN
ncbi:hypothetical protein OQA88_6043 [Cercophora sp. LCS_1]